MPRSRTQAGTLRGPGTTRPVRKPGRFLTPTFGLITAMPEEFQAMRALLSTPKHIRVAGDRADYVLGSLPSLHPRLEHAVVLTLTAGTGNHAGAAACQSLGMAFPSVNAVTMVGMAAGVPRPCCPEWHVRLGDIVVATDGVVDYRHVVQRGDGDELYRPFPLPSALLDRADRMLQAGEHTQQHPWETWLQVSGQPGLSGFRRPPEDADVLHSAAPAGQVIPHPARHLSGHRRGLPKVHRGRIGSADVSMHSSEERDRLASRHGLLAFEMEGAGVGDTSFLNGLEWFMVRGISDYADEHAGTRWRRYASLAAAAYVRALLGVTPPAAPRGGQPLAGGPVRQAGEGEPA